MTTDCGPVVRGSVYRLTRLDACGVPVIGSSSTQVGTFVSVARSPQYETSDPIRITAASGALCVDEPGIANLAQEDLTIIFCQHDPDAINIMTGAPIVVDAATPTPNKVGNRRQCGPSTAKFALELWATKSGQTCTTTTREYWYGLWPMVTMAQFQDDTFENGANQLTIQASAFCGGGWDVGPYDVVPGALLAPSPLLTPIASNDLFHWEWTTIAPPTAACGAVALA